MTIEQLNNLYNATCNSNGDELEQYDDWIQRQLIIRIERIKELEDQNKLLLKNKSEIEMFIESLLLGRDQREKKINKLVNELRKYKQ